MLLEHFKQWSEIQASQRMSIKDCLEGMTDAKFIAVCPDISLDADTPRCEGGVERNMVPVVIV